MLAIFGLLGAKMAELAAAADPKPAVSGPVHQPASLLTVPLFHATATHAIFLPCFYSVSKLVIMHKWDARHALQLIQGEWPRWATVCFVVHPGAC